MTNSALEVKNLTKDYGDFVLDKLNFTLPRGVIMGLIGENGAGKSTTINCILNEIQKDDCDKFMIIYKQVCESLEKTENSKFDERKLGRETVRSWARKKE